MREIVSVELPSDYIKAIEYWCLKTNLSRELFLKKCIEQLVFDECYLPIDYDIDVVYVELEEMGLKPNKSIEEEIREYEEKKSC